jgi:hypothetical protein
MTSFLDLGCKPTLILSKDSELDIGPLATLKLGSQTTFGFFQDLKTNFLLDLDNELEL